MSDEMIGARSAIPGYAGHADTHARRLADQQVRAWVGERLAALRERLPLDGATEVFDDVIFHCEFGDQHVIKALEDARFGEAAPSAALEAADDRLLVAAASADTIDGAGLPAFLAGLRDAFAQRTATIVALKG